jgi:hypothetical protein
MVCYGAVQSELTALRKPANMPKEYFHGTDGMLMTDRLPIIDSTGSSWSCPVCGRRFKQRTAEHTCQLFTLDHHLAGKPPEVVALCNAYLAAAAESGPVSIEPLKTAIMLRTRSNFGSVRVTRKHLSCYLILGGLPDAPRTSWLAALTLHAWRMSMTKCEAGCTRPVN